MERTFYTRIWLETKGGRLVMQQLTPRPKQPCSLCHEESKEVIEITVQASGGDWEGHVCGTCLCEGLAIAAGRHFVEAGGAISDLKTTEGTEVESDHIFTTSNVCERCGRSVLDLARRGGSCKGRPA